MANASIILVGSVIWDNEKIEIICKNVTFNNRISKRVYPDRGTKRIAAPHFFLAATILL